MTELQPTELQSRAEKYETRRAQCEASAQKAPEGPQREFFEVLAKYYRDLAVKFRQVHAKRETA
jgi:hypothetical protein